MEKGNVLFHKLDRYLGIPIVFSLGLFKVKKKIPGSINRIAILNLGSIGDNVLMSGPIANLRSKYPLSDITVFTGSTNFQIVQLIPGINNIVKLQITNPLKSIKLIRSNKKFDVVFDFGPWPRLNAIYTNFFKSSCTIGFKTNNQFRHFVYDIKIEHSSKLHEIDNFRNLISPIFSGESKSPQLNIVKSDKSVETIKKYGNYCIIHPWPGGYKSYMKEWDFEKWVSLCELINNKFDYILLTGSKDDTLKSQLLFEMLKGKCDNIIDISGQLNLHETVHLISNAKSVFSVNTGIAHIAAALNIFQICLHGPTNVIRWRPYNEFTVSLIPVSGTYGYLNYGHEYNYANGNCMENISVEQVYNAYLEIIKTIH